MSAHYHYPKLPAREIAPATYKYENLKSSPEAYRCKLLGSIHLGFVHGSEYLLVWQCDISKIVFFYELSSSSDWDILQLSQEEHEYSWSSKFPCYQVVYPQKKEQFKHFVMGWKPSVWDYDKKEREELCAAIDKAFEGVPF